MSTRYVWGKYNITKEPGASKQLVSSDTVTWEKGKDGTTELVSLIGNEISFHDEYLIVDVAGTPSAGVYAQSACRYAQPLSYGGAQWTTYKTKAYEDKDYSASSNNRWIGRKGTQHSSSLFDVTFTLEDRTTGTKKSFYKLTLSEIDARGTFISDASGNTSSRYPSNGVSGSYWYTYKGSDVIDPVSVTYSGPGLQAGGSANVIVSPRTPTYGGTVRYQYSYSTDGGNTWTNAGSVTTATSKTITIPANAAQFQARVLASDDLGFTSSTYVYGENETTKHAPTAPAYVTIPNDVYPGEEFEISWGASTDPDGDLAGYQVYKVYDGKTGSSNWQLVSSNATGTSLMDSVIEGHTSVRYMVWAKDSLGFTSSVTSSNTAIIGKIKAYATVGGKLRAGAKMYPTVGGKIRQIQKGYATVGGKIRKMF